MLATLGRAYTRAVYTVSAGSFLAAIFVAALRPDGVFGGMIVGGVL